MARPSLQLCSLISVVKGLGFAGMSHSTQLNFFFSPANKFNFANGCDAIHFGISLNHKVMWFHLLRAGVLYLTHGRQRVGMLIRVADICADLQVSKASGT